MKAAGNYISAAGFVTYLFSCCLIAINENKWYVPMLIGLAGILLMAAGANLIKLKIKKDEMKCLKENSRLSRHCYDADKLRQSEDMRNTYQELILKEIWS